MAKLLFASDLHAHNHTAFATILPNGRNSRLQDCLNIIMQAQQVACDRKVDGVFFLGDLFHSRVKIDMDVYTETWSYVKGLAELFPVFLLKGNHDCYSKIGDVHSLATFTEICRVLDEPEQLSTFVPKSCRPIGCTIDAFPYTADVEKLLLDIRNLEKPGELLLLHQAMREGAVGPYGMTGHGELSINDLPLDRYRFVFAGDYHKRQFFGPNSKVHYIGSPLQLTFGEAGECKAFTLLDTDTWTTEDIPTSAPRFFVYDTPADYLDAKEAGLVRPEIDFIRVLYDEQHREAAEVVKADCARVQVVEESQQKAVLQRIGNEVASSDTLLLEAYIEQKAGPLDKDRLLSIGLEELCGETA